MNFKFYLVESWVGLTLVPVTLEHSKDDLCLLKRSIIFDTWYWNIETINLYIPLVSFYYIQLSIDNWSKRWCQFIEQRPYQQSAVAKNKCRPDWISHQLVASAHLLETLFLTPPGQISLRFQFHLYITSKERKLFKKPRKWMNLYLYLFKFHTKPKLPIYCNLTYYI